MADTVDAYSMKAATTPNRQSGWWRRSPLAVTLLLLALGSGVYVVIGFVLRPVSPPAPTVDTAVAPFVLLPLKADKPGLSDRDLTGRVTVVNFFASWCVPCRAEAPLVMELAAKQGVMVQGINFRDDPSSAIRWVAELGDPFERIGVDRDGKLGISWDVLGLPATFVVDRRGRIRYRHLGLLTREHAERDLVPLIRKLERVAIARALANEPDVLLLDEPTGNLDSTAETEFLDLLQELHGQGRTLVMVTHSPAVAARAERLVKVKDGRIEAGG